MPSNLAIESLNTVATNTIVAYLDSVQDNVLHLGDRTRLVRQACPRGGTVSRESPTKLTPESASRLDTARVFRDSRQSACPTCRLAEAVHCTGSGRTRGRESARRPLTLPPEAGGSTPDHSTTNSIFPFINPRPPQADPPIT